MWLAVQNFDSENEDKFLAGMVENLTSVFEVFEQYRGCMDAWKRREAAGSRVAGSPESLRFAFFV